MKHTFDRPHVSRANTDTIGGGKTARRLLVTDVHPGLTATTHLVGDDRIG